MDSLAAARRRSALGRRVAIAGAALLVAWQVAQSGHPMTALVLALVAVLAVSGMVPGLASAPDIPASAQDLGAAREVDRLRALLDAVNAALFVVDNDGRIAFANRAARQLAGGEVARLDDVAALGAPAVEALRALPAGQRRIMRAQDGRNLFAWCGAFVIPGARPERLLSLQWITGELDAVEIEAWHAMARVLTHEMMNSLTPIVSLAESVAALAPEMRTEETMAPALATIARRGTHLLRFIERYRALGDLPRPAPVMLDAGTLLADIAHTVRQEMEAAGIALILEKADPAPLVAADPDLIERALLNLIRNAAEAAMGSAAAKVMLGLSASRGGVDMIVSDNGPGISPARIDEMFVPFATTKPNGSGIGLPLARQIAAMHGGWLIARAGCEGMEFVLHLPAFDGGEPAGLKMRARTRTPGDASDGDANPD